MIDTKKVSLGVLIFVLGSMPCLAFSSQTIEASTVVTGSIVVTPTGSVSGYTLDRPQKLSTGVVAVLAKIVPEWTFQPYLVDGKPVAAKSRMSIRLVARKLAHGEYSVAVGGATFHSGPPAKWSDLKIKRVPPRYPPEAIRQRVSGTVYLVVRVNHHGMAQDVAARQVDLRVLGTSREMKAWRKLVSQASMVAVRRWTFKPPASAFPASQRYWYAAIPVSFNLSIIGHEPGDAYGRWQSYVRGPVNFIPWLDPRQLAAGSADALSGGGILPLDGSGLRLQTPLDGS